MLDDAREVLGVSLIAIGFEPNNLSSESLDKAYRTLLTWDKNISQYDSDSFKNEVQDGTIWFGQAYNGDALQVMQETEARMQSNQRELNTMLLGLQKFSEAIPSLWKQYEERFVKVDADLGKAFGELADGSEQFRSSVEEFVKQLDQQFSKAVNGLSGAIKELAEEREQPSFQNRANAG